MTPQTTTYDVAVIGGGPAGMMAAGRAAEGGARVVLLEKNGSLGKKLLITGGGRCNVTNAELEVQKFLTKFKGSKKFLFAPFSRHSVQESLDFFHDRGMPTKTEAENRVFPKSNSAESVWEVLVAYLKETNVTVLSKSPVTDFETNDGVISGVKLSNGKIVRARTFILATGGKSRPETGSTGDGFVWLKQLGHTVVDTNAALVPLRTKEPWVKRLAGVSLKEAKITIVQNGKPQLSDHGKMLFTHFGLSGPVVLNMSKAIGELLPYDEVTLEIDLVPGVEQSDLDQQIQKQFREQQNKKIKNSLGGVTPPSLVPVILELATVDPEKPVNIVSRVERLSIVRLLKKLPLTVSGLMGTDKAVVTSGGVDLKEIDTKTMQSRIYQNLFIIGDVLNIDRPSGGYSLQLCWTTGFVAGTSAAELATQTHGN